MVHFCRVVTLIACVLSLLTLLWAIFGGGSAIQEAALAAIAAALAIIPYVFTEWSKVCPQFRRRQTLHNNEFQGH